MAQSYYELLKHPHWQRRRLQVMEAAGWACVSCGEANRTLNVHHRIYRKGAKPWEYADHELACLCEGCHKEEHATREQLAEVMAVLYDGDIRTLLGIAKAIALTGELIETISLESFEEVVGFLDHLGAESPGFRDAVLAHSPAAISMSDVTAWKQLGA